MSSRFTDFSGLRPLLLAIGHLKKLGVLEANGTSWVDIGVRITVIRTSESSLTIVVPKFPFDDSGHFPLDERKYCFRHDIRYVYRKLQFGFRPYFVCPITGDDCLKLVLYKGLVASIPAFELIKSDGSLSKRAIQYEARRVKFLKLDGTLRVPDHERERLLTFLERHPRRMADDQQVLGFLQREEHRKALYEKKRRWESRRLSTTKAFDEGVGANQMIQFQNYLLSPLEWFEGLPPPGLPTVPTPPDSIEHYPQLNARVLLE